MSAAAMPNQTSPHYLGRWSIVIPVYNEEDYVVATLKSLLAQSTPVFEIFLVDNGSTDQTPVILEKFSQEHPDVKVTLMADSRPGRINATQTGVNAVETEFVALCDADTIYPPHYLETAAAMLHQGSGDYVAALAFGVYSDAGPARAWFTRMKGMVAAWLMPRQAHTGGYGQCFKTAALKQSGGYSSALWPFTVADHEIIHRILRYGRLAYSKDHWCLTSARRDDRRHVDWTLFERVLYHVTPHRRKDWLFYKFYWPRFEKRKMLNSNLRQRAWQPASPSD